MFDNIKKAYYRWKIKKVLETLKNLDIIMARAGWNRKQRKEFYRTLWKKENKDAEILSLFGGGE